MPVTMVTAPHSERLEFYKFKYAASMFAEARAVLQYIKDQKIDSNHPLHHSLWTSFHIFYGKPFKQRPSIRIEQVIVPDEYKDAHQAIITLRDKMFAHSDLNGLDSDSGEALNAIFATFTGGPPTFGFRLINPADDQLDRYSSLVDALIQSANFHASKPWKKWVRKLPVEMRGLYRFNTSEESDDLLKKPR